jgi:hypothetical protein
MESLDSSQDFGPPTKDGRSTTVLRGAGRLQTAVPRSTQLISVKDGG